MNSSVKTKEEIIENVIMKNIRRRSGIIDQVQIVKGVPLFSWIDINPVELCNRKCVFCPRVDADFYPNRNLHMSIGLAQKIADELRSYEYKGGVIFSGFGEPLLHKNFVELVSVFGKDIHTELVTNGDRLTEDLVKELYGAGLDVILVSMYDGPHQVEKFKSMFHRSRVPEDQYVLRDRWYGEEQDYGLLLLNRAGAVHNGHQHSVEIGKPCYYPHYFMQIDWNGEVLLCVHDWSKKTKFGDINKQSLLEVWAERSFIEYRSKLGKGSRSLSPCNQCNANGTLHGINHAQSWDKILHKP